MESIQLFRCEGGVSTWARSSVYGTTPWRQTPISTDTHTYGQCRVAMRPNVLFLDRGRKLEHVERVRASTETGRARRLHTERPRARDRTCDLFCRTTVSMYFRVCLRQFIGVIQSMVKPP